MVKRKMFICEIGIIIILICQKLGLVGPGQQNIKLPSPYQLYKLLERIEKTWRGRENSANEF